MSSSNVENYEVLSILGADLHSTCYKVKHKTTSKVYVWKAMSYDNFTESGKSSLIPRIEKIKQFKHSNLLDISDFIFNEDIKVLYLVCEFCENGNLSSIVQKCLIENERLSEDFIWRMLYQIACALKVTGVQCKKLCLNNIFLDENYNVKLFNNDALNLQKFENCSIGFIIYQLCILQSNTNDINLSTKEIILSIPKYYSNELKEMLKFMLNNSFEQSAIIDAIICHPTILLKLLEVNKHNLYVKNEKSNNNVNIENASNNEKEALFQSRLENIKNREIALKIREEKLGEKARELHKREKKVGLSERTVRDKMIQAELYLKRCREVKSTGSALSNGKLSYENLDSSYSADCNESTFNIPTSGKINSQFIKKPTAFTRMLSERRIVRFKGHSPLKNLYGNRNSPQQKHVSTNKEEISKECVQGKSKSRIKLDLSFAKPRNRKPLLDLNNQSKINHEELDFEASNKQQKHRPVSWTEDSKQHAFDLLRLINQKVESSNIKHTYL